MAASVGHWNGVHKMADRQITGSIRLAEYADQVRPTDRLSEDDLRPVLMGLFGEVGSIMATAKKLHREKAAYTGYHDAAVEEFGDALWYFTALCRRLGRSVAEIMGEASQKWGYDGAPAAGDIGGVPLVQYLSPAQLVELDAGLIALGEAAANLLVLAHHKDAASELLRQFAIRYLDALAAAKLSFAEVARTNIRKVRGRFLMPEPSDLPTFDISFEADERLPDEFEIRILQRKNGQSALQWNGVFIGDPLTDNIGDPDGFRYHDVFHFAHAAILHWSPTFRALIKHKRKSDRKVDEAQDGGRAIVVEEGLTAWLFSRAKQLNFFDGQTGVSLDLLKVIQQFVSGYEVEECPLALWENAILQGYDVFRSVKKSNGGIIIGSRLARTIRYQSDAGMP